MKIENLPRAIKAASELKEFQQNLEVLGKFLDKVQTEGGVGFHISECRDGSGLHTVPFYLNGNYNKPLVEECLKAIFLIFVRHEEELRQEIDDL